MSRTETIPHEGKSKNHGQTRGTHILLVSRRCNPAAERRWPPINKHIRLHNRVAQIRGGWPAGSDHVRGTRWITFSVFSVDDFGTRLRRVIGAVSQSDILLKKNIATTSSGELVAMGWEHERSRGKTFPQTCDHDNDSGRSTDSAPAGPAARRSRAVLRFQPNKVFSPPRGRSENHAARSLDRPARSRDSANIGSRRLRGYRGYNSPRVLVLANTNFFSATPHRPGKLRYDTTRRNAFAERLTSHNREIQNATYANSCNSC